jgi:hypothetical protein
MCTSRLPRARGRASARAASTPHASPCQPPLWCCVYTYGAGLSPGPQALPAQQLLWFYALYTASRHEPERVRRAVRSTRALVHSHTLTKWLSASLISGDGFQRPFFTCVADLLNPEQTLSIFDIRGPRCAFEVHRCPSMRASLALASTSCRSAGKSGAFAPAVFTSRSPPRLPQPQIAQLNGR